MTDYAELTLEAFYKGINCAQVVLSVFASEFGIDGETARKIASGFGGGTGRMGGTCGAVNAAYMVLSLKYGDADGQDSEAREMLVRQLRTFRRRFENERGSISCRELIGFNLRDPFQYNKVVERGLFFEVCPNLVADVIGIVREIIEQNAMNIAPK